MCVCCNMYVVLFKVWTLPEHFVHLCPQWICTADNKHSAFFTAQQSPPAQHLLIANRFAAKL